MNKRIILKTSLICFGVFILLSTVLIWLLKDKYKINNEKEFNAAVALVPIEPGTVINEGMIGLRTIKESSFNSSMISDLKSAAGTKSKTFIGQNDYLRDYELISKDKWYKEDERTIVLPMEAEERLANMVKKGSYVDIKLIPKEVKSIPELVLSKVIIEDVLDENGVSLGNTGVNKKAFVSLVLEDAERDKIYVARDMGKLILELYCDTTQTPPVEEFQIPKEYMMKTR